MPATLDRWDCCDTGHRKRYAIRRNGAEVVERKGRNCWWPFVLRDLGYLGWMETDLARGDPGNPTLNHLPCADVFVGPIDDPLSAPVKLLAAGAGPHPEATDRGVCVRRVAGPGRIELAELDPTGRDLGTHVTRNILTDPSWAAGNFTWCEDGAIVGDGLPLIGVHGITFYDPARYPYPDQPGTVAALTELGDGRWCLAVFALGGWPYLALPPADGPKGGATLLGPPRWVRLDGVWRLLVQHAIVGEQAWQAKTVVPGDPSTLRTEWAEAAGHVRFPVIA